MYTVNILDIEVMEWKPLKFKDKIMKFSSKSTLFRALKNNLGVSVQIIYEEWFLEVLDGSEEQLYWFINNHDRLLNKTLQAMHTEEVYQKRKLLNELQHREF